VGVETDHYSVSRVFTFKVMRKFNKLYDKYTLKQLPKNNNRFVKSKSKMLKDLIDSKFSGKREKKLLEILSKGDKTTSEIKNETGVRDVPQLVYDVRQKLKGTAFKIVSIKSNNFIEYKMYRLVNL
jgi:hypothetical protein